MFLPLTLDVGEQKFAGEQNGNSMWKAIRISIIIFIRSVFTTCQLEIFVNGQHFM